jgi:hypothetical protein
MILEVFYHDLNIFFGGGDSLRTYKPAVAKFLVPDEGDKVDSGIYIYMGIVPARGPVRVGCLRNFVYSKFRIFRMFF